MEFKGSQGKWGCVFTSDKKRAVRNKGGLICILTKPFRYSGQDERYDRELEENRNDQRLIAAAPELLEALHLSNEWLKKIAPAYKGTEYFEIIEHGIKKNEKAIKKALE